MINFEKSSYSPSVEGFLLMSQGEFDFIDTTFIHKCLSARGVL